MSSEHQKSMGQVTLNDFPSLGINTEALIDEIEGLLEEAANHKEEMGAVNWGDLGVMDVEYRLSMMHPGSGPCCHVLIEEASPECELARWLYERLDHDKYPNTYVECEW